VKSLNVLIACTNEVLRLAVRYEGYPTTVTEASRMSAFMYEIHTRLSCCTLKFRDHFQRQRRGGGGR